MVKLMFTIILYAQSSRIFKNSAFVWIELLVSAYERDVSLYFIFRPVTLDPLDED